MFRCETCDNSYHYQEDCDDHMDYRHHWPQCETCDREFDTQRGCDQHMDRREHWAPKPCETCHATFRTRGAARRHMDAEDHYSQFCVPCELSFKDQNELRVVRCLLTSCNPSVFDRWLIYNPAPQLAHSPRHHHQLPLLQKGLHYCKRTGSSSRDCSMPTRSTQSRPRIHPPHDPPAGSAWRYHYEAFDSGREHGRHLLRHRERVERSCLGVLPVPPWFCACPRSHAAPQFASAQAEPLPLHEEGMW